MKLNSKYGDMSMYNYANYDICKFVNRIKLNLVSFGYASVSTEWKGKVPSPVYSRLYYVASGNSSITPEKSPKINLEVGKWYLIPAGCTFNYECFSEMEHYYFHLKLCDYDGTDLLRRCTTPLIAEVPEDFTHFMDKCIQSGSMLDGLYLQQIAFNVLLEMLKKYNIDVKSENYSACVMKAIRYINDNLSVRLTISEIAENIFVSKSTLTKSFRRELSMSVNEYIYDVVMSKAEYLLKTSNLTILEISDKFGFYDQFYFSKRFREKFRFSPREYRKNNPI